MRFGIAVFLAVLVMFVVFLFYYMAVGPDAGAASGSSKTYNVTVDAPRGEILDRNGVALVSNRQGNALRFNAAFFPSKQTQRNEEIYVLINLLESRNEKWTDNLPIVEDKNGNFVFANDRDSDIKAMKSKNYLNLNSYASADDCLYALSEMYDLDKYDRSAQRKLASVQYEMWRTGYSVSSPYTFADDVSDDTVSIIKANSDKLAGVEPLITSYREIPDGTIAPHIIGETGVISEDFYNEQKEKLDKELDDSSLSDEEKANLKLNAYSVDDVVGQFGIESAMEKYLRGKKGIQKVTVSSDGSVDTSYSVNPSQGDTVVLTIDAGLQRVAQNALENRVKQLVDTSTGLEAAGACVVLDADTSEVLASATYPSYDLNEYYKNYSKLLKADGNPLINRVLQSTYEPGSTFKPAMAIAGLESGVIDINTEFYCSSVFQYYDMKFGCLSAHGNQTVRDALQNSCNIYFYNVGERLGIDRMNEYCRKLGLGKPTGVELSESDGILAGREYRQSIGSVWQMGDTIQAAIGQSDNLFNIMQLANYCATIANGGTRHRCHFVKYITDPSTGTEIYDAGTKTLENTGFSQKNLNIVKEGMYRVAKYGTPASTFSQIPENVAAKTGTTQVKRLVNGKYISGNNGLIISFAPYEDPEIVVAVIVENVDSGSATAQVAADIYNYYFSTRTQVVSGQNTGTLLR